MTPRSDERLGAARTALATALLACSVAAAEAGSFERYTFANQAGARDYKVYVPSAHAATPPLIVDLHGCSSNPDEEARWSRFNELADQYGFLVAYPEQSPDANGGKCWNWFLPDHQSRGAGEPSIIAGITDAVINGWNVDRHRVYIAGVSAGAGMSDVMAVTYPDLYAAAMIYAGCEYKGTTCLGALGALPPEVSGRLAYQAMGAHARVVPLIVIQGDTDVLVPFPNAELIIGQFLASDDWADDGDNNCSVSRRRSATRSGTKPGGQSYDVDSYIEAGGCLLAERWLVHGMGHMWSNAPSNGSPRDLVLTDPLGPDVTTPIVEFFLSHPMPEQGTGCQ